MGGTNPKREEEQRTIPSRPSGILAMWQPWMICPLLAVLTAVVYWPVMGFGFINYDDPGYFSINRHVLTGLSWPNFLWAFQATDEASWYPLTWLSYLLDATLFGKGAAGPHVTNLVLHVVNTLLVFHLLKQLTGARWRSAFVAALFALHPLHVESVAWIAERKGLLSTCFGLLTLMVYARYATVKTGEKVTTQKVMYHGLAVFFYICGLLSKPALVTLPVALLLLDYWPLKRVQPATCRTFIPLLWEKIPFVVFALLSSAVTILVHKQSGSLTSLATISIPNRIEAAIVSYAWYLEKMFWPVKLALPYPDPGNWPLLVIISAVVLIAGLSIVAVWCGRRRPYVLVGWFWFVVMLLPVIGIIGWGSHTVADRYTYVPLLGIFIIISWRGAELCEGKLKWVGVGISVGILAACALRTTDQLRYWKNSETLFRHSIAVTEKNIVGLDHLGIRLSFEGRGEEAIGYFDEALRLNPDGPQVLYDLGNALAAEGLFAEAATNFEAALIRMPQHAEAHNNLGLVLARLGRSDEAIAHYQEALKYAPDYVETRKNLAEALGAKGRIDEAIEQYKLVLNEDPLDADMQYALGVALAVRGKWDEAIPHYAETVRLSPTNAAARYNFGYALRVRGRLDEAETQLNQAVQLKPEFPLAHFNLGCVLLEKRETNEAVVQLKEALKQKPDYAEAKRQLEAIETRPKE